MAAVPLFRDTDMAAVMSRENTLFHYVLAYPSSLFTPNKIVQC